MDSSVADLHGPIAHFVAVIQFQLRQSRRR
jgi:hypothetical protein